MATGADSTAARPGMAEKISVTVPSAPRYIKGIRALCQPLCEELGFPADVTSNLCLALNEACANVIEHACGGDPHKEVSVEFWVAEDRIEMKVLNYCRKSEVSQCKPRPLDEVRPGGLGTHFIEALMDRVQYVPGAGDQMDLVLLKRRPGGNS